MEGEGIMEGSEIMEGEGRETYEILCILTINPSLIQVHSVYFGR